MVRTSKTIRRALVPVLGAAVIAVAIAGCGSSKSASPSPSPTTSKAGLAGAAAALKTYIAQVTPIATQVETTVKGLPDAVKGISKKPDSTWTTAAGNLDQLATQLGDEADALAALTPPTTLQPVQDAAVQGLQRTQTAVTKLADSLNKRQATAATRKARILAKIDQLQSQLGALATQLVGSLQGLLPSGSTPTP